MVVILFLQLKADPKFIGNCGNVVGGKKRKKCILKLKENCNGATPTTTTTTTTTTAATTTTSATTVAPIGIFCAKVSISLTSLLQLNLLLPALD